jgi:N-acetyl-anhydromuramyl-L-alanine amidase AmpD
MWHATAVKPGVPLWKRIVKYEPGVDRAASWNLLIEEDGSIYQSVSFERGAWHCGRGSVDGIPINRSTIGIELAAGEDYMDRQWPSAQVDAAQSVLDVIILHYNLMDRSRVSLLHSAYDPTRRSDPGRSWERELRRLVGSIA